MIFNSQGKYIHISAYLDIKLKTESDYYGIVFLLGYLVL